MPSSYWLGTYTDFFVWVVGWAEPCDTILDSRLVNPLSPQPGPPLARADPGGRGDKGPWPPQFANIIKDFGRLIAEGLTARQYVPPPIQNFGSAHAL